MDSPTAYPDDVRLPPTSSEPTDLYDAWTPDLTEIAYSNTTNATQNATIIDEELSYKYIYVSTALVIFCAVSVVINIKVLASAYWIKRPLSPTLHISLSLAGADAFASFHLGLGLFINSLLDKGFKVEGIPVYVPILVEVFRLGGVIITVAHLLALAVNHYLGIIKPLHYPSIMTHRNRTICIVLMWIIPISFLVVYFSVIKNQGFQPPFDTDFYRHSRFRLTYSSMFFCPLILMSIIYTHIFVIVRRHQLRRLRFSQWSQYNRENGDYTRSSNQQRDIAMSVKAIKTTLLILGSYIVGLMPAALIFVFVCEDCLATSETFTELVGGGDNSFAIFVFINFLVIFKTMLNPIIYAARMHEIKPGTDVLLLIQSRTDQNTQPYIICVGTQEEGGQSSLVGDKLLIAKASSIMKTRLCGSCCRLLAADGISTENTFGMSSECSQGGHHRLTQYTESSLNPQRSNTVICRMRPNEPIANGGSRTKSLSRTSTRSHQRRRAELTLV